MPILIVYGCPPWVCQLLKRAYVLEVTAKYYEENAFRRLYSNNELNQDKLSSE